MPIPASAALQVEMGGFIRDTTFAELTGFQLDMDEGTISFTFSDVVRVSSFQPTGVTIQSNMPGSESIHTLNTAILDTVDDGYFIDFNLSQADLQALQANPELATSENNTFVSIQSAVSDVNGFLVVAVVLQVDEYFPDTTPPTILQFSLDVDSGILRLTFSEVVNTSTLEPTEITLQNTIDGNDTYIQLNMSEVTPTTPASVVDVLLSFEDLEEIKIMMQFAVDENTTYLAATNETVRDMVGLPLVAIPRSNALVAVEHLEDQTAPMLTNFSLDLNTGILTFTFDETVLVNTLTFGSITLQSTQFFVPVVTTQVTLSGGMVIPGSTDGTIVQIYLSDGDFNLLNSDTTIAQSESTTYISLVEGAIQDTNFHPICRDPTNQCPPGWILLLG